MINSLHSDFIKYDTVEINCSISFFNWIYFEIIAVPTQKTPRLLTTNAAACRALWRKSELMGYDTAAYEETESQINALREVPRKWNVPPAFR